MVLLYVLFIRHVPSTRCTRIDEHTYHLTHVFSIDESLPDLPRIGVRYCLDHTLRHLSWYGHGPHETYIDRCESGVLRVHNSLVEEQYVPYILPQDHGNHTGVRWLTLQNKSALLSIRSLTAMEASASHYPHELLTGAFHTYEVTPDNHVWLCLDAMQRGVGGASCGPDTLPQYHVAPGHYELAYLLSIRPV